MSDFYKREKIVFPVGFRKVTDSFKKKVFLAVLALLSFVGMYFSLMIWFGILSYESFANVSSPGDLNPLLRILTGVCLAFLSLFMFKSLFVFKKNEHDAVDIEVDSDSERELVSFVYALADEINAPRPHKIFLSPRVNASVFYDLSILNLIIPAKKNLEIGLGLINVLSIGELKAVLAHEFGHFAQKSMLLGRYVYVAQKIASEIVHKRDALDQFIAGLSSVDFRIAWIGWLLSVFVWAMRALVETIFSLVVIAERALSREMEFQADLVSVSVTGSDALMQALYKLNVAEDGYTSSLSGVNELLAEKKRVPDMFALQTNYIQKMGEVFDDPMFGIPPENKNKSKDFKLFKTSIEIPSEMWSTHPSHFDREVNAKRVYLSAAIDDRSAWMLFFDPSKLRYDITESLINTAKIEGELTPITLKESIDGVNKIDFSWYFLSSRFNGAYLSRFSFLNFKGVDEIYESNLASDSLLGVSKMYPKELKDVIAEFKRINDEIDSLKQLEYTSFERGGRPIVFRGKEIKKKDINGVITQLNNEKSRINEHLKAHDAICRNTCLKEAKKHGEGVVRYIRNVTTLVHYAEHQMSLLDVETAKFQTLLATLFSGSKVSETGVYEIISLANTVRNSIKAIYKNSSLVVLDNVLLDKIGGKQYSELFDEFKLDPANRENIQSWLEVWESWLNVVRSNTVLLRNAALDRLLEVESLLVDSAVNQTRLELVCGDISAVNTYQKYDENSVESYKYEFGLWEKIQLGEGFIGFSLKLSAALAVIGFALFFGNMSSTYKLYLHNGLNIPLTIAVNGKEYNVDPGEYSMGAIEYDKNYTIVSSEFEGDTLEKFELDATNRGDYLYNALNASYLYEYTVVYGGNDFPENTLIGSQKCIPVNSDYILRDAPQTIKTESSVVHKTVLAIASGISPYNLPNESKDSSVFYQMIKHHAMYDPSDSKYILAWCYLASTYNEYDYVFERFKRDTLDVIAHREYQDNVIKDDTLKSVFYKEMLKSYPDNADVFYLYARSFSDEKVQNLLFLEGYEKWPSNKWLSFGSSYIYASKYEWEKSAHCFNQATVASPVLMSSIGIDFERVNRIAKAFNVDFNGYDDVTMQHESVKYYNKIIKDGLSAFENDANKAHFLLLEGKYDQALEEISNFSDNNIMNLKIFMSVSDGAPENIVEEVLSSNNEGLNYINVWIKLALFIKEGKDCSTLLERVKELDSLKDIQFEELQFFVSELNKRNYNSLKNMGFEQLDFRMEANCRLMGAIVMGEKVPDEWTKVLKAYLYFNEKPNITVLQ